MEGSGSGTLRPKNLHTDPTDPKHCGQHKKRRGHHTHWCPEKMSSRARTFEAPTPLVRRDMSRMTRDSRTRASFGTCCTTRRRRPRSSSEGGRLRIHSLGKGGLWSCYVLFWQRETILCNGRKKISTANQRSKASVKCLWLPKKNLRERKYC